MPGWFRKPAADPSPASRGPSCLSSPLLFGCSHFDYYNQTTLERNGRPSLATTVGLASRGRAKGKVASTYWSRGLNSRVQLTRHYCPLLPLPTTSPAHRRSSKGESTGSLHGASKAYYALEHLDDLFRPLLFSLRAAMHVKRFCGWASGSVCYWSPPKLGKLQVQKSYKTCLLSWGYVGPRSRPDNRPLLFIRRWPGSERETQSPYSGCDDIDPTRSSARDPLGLQALLPKRSLLVVYRSNFIVKRCELPRSLALSATHFSEYCP